MGLKPFPTLAGSRTVLLEPLSPLTYLSSDCGKKLGETVYFLYFLKYLYFFSSTTNQIYKQKYKKPTKELLFL